MRSRLKTVGVAAPRGLAAMMMAGALLLAVPQSAKAQGSGAGAPSLTTGQWTVTPVVGTAFAGDVDSPTVVLGVAGGYNWSPRVSFEGEFNLLPSSETGGIVELNSKVWNLTGNVLYRFSGQNFTPYGAFGLGVGHGSADVNINDPLLTSVSSSSTNLVVNFGGGVERSITDAIRLRGDLRYFFGGDLVADYWRFGVGVSFNVGHPR
jgi:opacity protein-like surface antigen